ncbi:MAG: PQQ-binding-like beta-propeller repeat protein [Polyangiaceae bacterium]
MTLRAIARLGLAIGMLGALEGCVAQTSIGKAFTLNWEDDKGDSIRKLEAKLRSVPIPAATDVAIGVTDKGIVGVPLGGGSPWTFEHVLDGRPDVGGSVVVGLGGEELFALQASTGKLLWKRPASNVTLRGVGDDGTVTVVVFESKAGQGSTLLAVSRDGEVLRQQPTQRKLGRPAVVGNVAFIPWSGQYVSAYDISNGEEVARVTLRHQTSLAFITNKTMFFGESTLTRFDEQIGAASFDRASTLKLPEKNVIGGARWMAPAAEARPLKAGANDKARVVARAAARGEPIGFEEGRFATIYFRFAHGFDSLGNLKWVHTHPSDILGGASYKGGVALCDADGKITFLESETGLEAGQIELGQPIDSCVLQADQLSRAASGAKSKPLIDQVRAAMEYPSADMVAAQKFLLGEISKGDDAAVTKLLLDLYVNPKTSPVLLPEIEKRITERRSGVEAMLEALEHRYDYLADVLRGPPVGPIADALGAIGDKRGAPALAKQLNDPNTSSDDLRRAAAALETLATPAEAKELETFFALNRFTTIDAAIENALVSVAKALLRVGTDHGKDLVVRTAKDPLVTSSLQNRLPRWCRTCW